MKLKIHDHPDFVKDSHSILNVNSIALETYKKIKKINREKDTRISELENKVDLLNEKFNELKKLIMSSK